MRVVDRGDFVGVAETACASVYEAAHADMADPPGPIELLRRLYGRDAIRFVDVLPGRLFDVHQHEHTVTVKRRIGTRLTARAASIALATLFAAATGLPSSTTALESIGAFLRVPGPAFMRACGALGTAVTPLADAFLCSDVLIAMRLGELLNVPSAIYYGDTVYLRGDTSAWPSEASALGALKRCPPPNVRRVALRGDDGAAVALVLGAA